MTREQQRTWIAFGLAIALPVAVAAALIPARDHTDNTNIALVMVVIVVVIAMFGRRFAAAVAAISSAAWFDFFHTQPHYKFTIQARGDVVTAVLLLLVGLVVGELAVRSRRHEAVATRRADELTRVHAVAELVASGEPLEYVIMAVADELRELLTLRDIRFDMSARDPEERPLPKVQRDGEVVVGPLRWGTDSMGLPGRTVELEVDGGGRRWGRYLLEPTPGLPVPFVRRIVAVAMADLVGAAMAARGTLPRQA
jgi:K+-sensing histidine kinase KdpD